MSDEIEKALRYDALNEAEKLTGESYKDDEGTSNLGMFLHIQHNRHKEALLKANNDTTFAGDMGQTLDVALDIGYEEILSDYMFYEEDGEKQKEKYYILWHPKGLMLILETYSWGYKDCDSKEASVNCATMMYNVDGEKEIFELGGSGGYVGKDSKIRHGYKDVREGLRHETNKVLECNPVPWKKIPRSLKMWCDYENHCFMSDGDTLDEIAHERFMRLPQEVLDFCNYPEIRE